MEVNAEFVGKISCQVESLLIIVSNVLGRRLVFQADSNIQAEHYGIKFQPLTDFKRKKKLFIHVFIIVIIKFCNTTAMTSILI